MQVWGLERDIVGFLIVTQNIDIEISRGKSLLAENTYILTMVNGRENRNGHALIIIMVCAYMRLKACLYSDTLPPTTPYQLTLPQRLTSHFLLLEEHWLIPAGYILARPM